MKCPKCNYTSFDYNQICPKCGSDNSEEQTRLKFSANKPNPPFFLASLIGTPDSESSEMMGETLDMTPPKGGYGGMDGEDLLIALDDLEGEGTKEEAAPQMEPPEEEIVFDMDDLKEDGLTSQESADDEVLFDLLPESEKDDGESVKTGPFDEKELMGDVPEDPLSPSALDMAEETAEISLEKASGPETETTGDIGEVDLFLDDETEGPKETPDESPHLEIPDHDIKDVDSPETLLSLDDLIDGEPEEKPSVTDDAGEEEILFELDDEDDRSHKKEISDEIVFELEETSDEGNATATKSPDEKKGFWHSDEINKEAVLSDLEEIEGGASDEKEASPFSDLDIEPLDLELSLDDIDKKP